MATELPPRAAPAVRDVVAIVALCAGVAIGSVGGFLISAPVGCFVTAGGLILLAILLGLG